MDSYLSKVEMEMKCEATNIAIFSKLFIMLHLHSQCDYML